MPTDPRNDRRAAKRYAAKGPPAFLGWYEGDDYRTTSVRLIDISMLGIKAEADVLPGAEDGVAWLNLAGQKPSSWIEVGIVSTSKQWGLFRTRRMIRLRFL